jgi:hypothetical protein
MTSDFLRRWAAVDPGTVFLTTLGAEICAEKVSLQGVSREMSTILSWPDGRALMKPAKKNWGG